MDWTSRLSPRTTRELARRGVDGSLGCTRPFARSSARAFRPINPYHFVERLFAAPRSRTTSSFVETHRRRSYPSRWPTSSAASGCSPTPALRAWATTCPRLSAQPSPDTRPRVICLAGDGSLQMNIQELQTDPPPSASREAIRARQLRVRLDPHVRRTTSSEPRSARVPTTGSSFPDFAGGRGGVRDPGRRALIEPSGSRRDHRRVLATDGPIVCHVLLDPEQGFEPRIKSRVMPDGTIVSPALDDMYPFLDPAELASARRSADSAIESRRSQASSCGTAATGRTSDGRAIRPRRDARRHQAGMRGGRRGGASWMSPGMHSGARVSRPEPAVGRHGSKRRPIGIAGVGQASCRRVPQALRRRALEDRRRLSGGAEESLYELRVGWRPGVRRDEQAEPSPHVRILEHFQLAAVRRGVVGQAETGTASPRSPCSRTDCLRGVGLDPATDGRRWRLRPGRRDGCLLGHDIRRVHLGGRTTESGAAGSEQGRNGSSGGRSRHSCLGELPGGSLESRHLRRPVRPRGREQPLGQRRARSQDHQRLRERRSLQQRPRRDEAAVPRR